ncbi:MAG: sigma-70 family RNA polymerase sigma factor [Acidobacteria bacterium]|nr:sigma-70 family RNA polymerase sigma factor [Acidobacteriota bacterium]
MANDNNNLALLSTEDQLENFENLALIHTQILLRTATRMCTNSSEADDIVQETLLRAWKYWHTFELGSNCRAWLFRIMINLIHRRRESLSNTAEHISVDEPNMANVLKFEPKLEMDEHGALVALNRLPTEYRDIIFLVLIEEFSYKEAAIMLNVPMGTVMSRLHRARQMMKKLLCPDNEDNEDNENIATA